MIGSLTHRVIVSLSDRAIGDLEEPALGIQPLGKFRERSLAAKITRLSAEIRYGVGLLAFFAFVAGDDAVFDVDDAVRVLGDVVFVGDEHDGVAFGVEAIEQSHVCDWDDEGAAPGTAIGWEAG